MLSSPTQHLGVVAFSSPLGSSRLPVMLRLKRPVAQVSHLSRTYVTPNKCRNASVNSQESPSSTGIDTPSPETTIQSRRLSPYYFDTGYALFAKRPSKPFPPPFLSAPSKSFSDALSTHNKSRDRRPTVNGEIIRGVTNGDDAVLVNEQFIAANDGVGAWATREKGHAALWSRLILHFWALEMEAYLLRPRSKDEIPEPDPIKYLQIAYENTVRATSDPNEWNGTTTACGALLDFKTTNKETLPILYVTNLGDSQCLVIRPTSGKESDIIFKTSEQWHWFDCPRQLGTNSPDTPKANAVLDKVELRENDVVLTMSDGVVDNLWEHEIQDNVIESLERWRSGDVRTQNGGPTDEGAMRFVAKELVKATRVVAENPYAESPFMERAIEEGLAMEGGKLDDISVVAAICRKRQL